MRSDNDLLARLNALKPSTVKLDSRPTAASLDVEVNEPQSIEDKLAGRLKTLRAGGSTSSRISSAGRDTADSLTARIKDEIATEKDPIRDWQQNEGEERSLEDLLAELGSDESQWKLDPEDPKHVASLLEEAKNALPPAEEESDHDRSTTNTAAFVDGERATDEESRSQNQDRQDEEEADDYVKRVLAELEVEKKYGTGAYDHDESERNPSERRDSEHTIPSSGLDLPSTPSNLLQSAKSTAPPSYEDSELEARFSKLGLDLPSTPSGAPSAKVSKKNLPSTMKGKAKSSLPTFTDEDMDSWCCICNEDGEVRCLGCDGDIYCNNCWRDGHGTGPGQESGHRAVQYNKGGGLAAA